jgi:UDP-N-acetylmuramoyl-tripeptide--D-alanyl-D-alanine ligase
LGWNNIYLYMAVLWNKEQLCEALNQELNIDEVEISRVSIDSRNIEDNDLFIALKGDNFNGNEFIDEAISKGAILAISDDETLSYEYKDKIIFVGSSQRALEKLAKKRRRKSQAKFIAVTGSVGKTSIKETLYELVKENFNSYKSFGNFNNIIGLPLSLANMPLECDLGIFELGMNHAGEISDLCQIVHPHISIISWIAENHIENFDSVDDIARAKAEIFEWMVPDGKAIIPADSDFYEILESLAEDNGLSNVISFGKLVNNVHINQSTKMLSGYFIDERIDFSPEIADRFILNNLLAILTCLKMLNIDLITALSRLEKVEPLKGRGKIYELNDNIKLIDDSYNAGPQSMKKSLEKIAKISTDGKKIVVIGEMLELGKDSEKYHKELVEYLGRDICLCLVGKGTSPLYEEVKSTHKCQYFENAEDAIAPIEKVLSANDVILIKGSNGSKVWKITDKLISNK